MIKRLLKYTLYIIVISVISYIIFSFIVRPSNDRDWTDDQKVLPEITFENSLIKINNIRNFKYTSTSDYQQRYYDEVYERGRVKNVWFIVEPFSGPQAAHTFVSFEFENGKFLAISVEIRKEKGETYHPISGLFRKYEVNYVLGDERDLIGLRANHRNDKVFLYRASTTKEKANLLFENMLSRAIKLQNDPEFYNTITNTCTTNLVSHVNQIVDDRIPFDYRILLPEYSDYLAYELGLISTDVTKEELKLKHKINDLAREYADREDFSYGIRKNLQ